MVEGDGDCVRGRDGSDAGMKGIFREKVDPWLGVDVTEREPSSFWA